MSVVFIITVIYAPKGIIGLVKKGYDEWWYRD